MTIGSSEGQLCTRFLHCKPCTVAPQEMLRVSRLKSFSEVSGADGTPNNNDQSGLAVTEVVGAGCDADSMKVFSQSLKLSLMRCPEAENRTHSTEPQGHQCRRNGAGR